MSLINKNKLARYENTAGEINSLAAEFLKSHFGTPKTSTHKSDSHYGIQEDLEANKMYEDYLRKNTPEVALFTEEGERNLDNEFVWVVDPIEGTSNYKSCNPFWATQIALLQDGEPVISVVNAPVLGQKFTAVKGEGAYLNGIKIKPTSLKELNLALIDMCRGTKDIDKEWMASTLSKVIKHVRTNRVFGSSGLQTAYSASGITDIFINNGSQLYDILPGILIAREAGASVLNFNGGEWTSEDSGYIVSNKILAEAVIKLLNE
jgi:myo-inositol-1(or 4)-monophosphatase